MSCSRSLLNQGAHLWTACKTDVINARVLGECVAHLMPQACDDVDGTWRKANLSGQLCNSDETQAGIFSRFDHTNVARCQCTPHTPAKYLHGVIPGHHMTCDAMGLAPCQNAIAVLVGNGVAMKLVTSARIKFKVARQRARICHGLLRRLAAVALL